MPIVECYVRFYPNISQQVRKGLKTRGCRIEEFDKNSEDVVDEKQAYIIKLKKENL